MKILKFLKKWEKFLVLVHRVGILFDLATTLKLTIVQIEIRCV